MYNARKGSTLEICDNLAGEKRWRKMLYMELINDGDGCRVVDEDDAYVFVVRKKSEGTVICEIYTINLFHVYS